MKTLKRFLILTLLLLPTLMGKASTDGVIRILAIGNSFSQDAVENYLHQLADSAGMKTVIANMYIGGCTLERHYNNAVNNTAAYSYRKIAVDGTKTSQENVALETALKDEAWDYISLQQASPLSGQYDTYTPYLAYLISYIKGLAPQSVKLVWHQTWAYSANCTLSGFANYGNDQQTMYQSIVKAARQAVTDYGFDILVPVGTAIQNARTTFIGDRMNRDGQHLNVYYGRYCAASTWLEAVLGVNPEGNTFVPAGVNESLKIATQRAAHAAAQQPDAITDLSDILNGEGAKAYFVVPDDDARAVTDGDGSAWDNAFTLTTFIRHIDNMNPGDIYYFAGGTYYPSATITLKEPCTLIGGFDPSLTGTEVPTLNYPSLTPTIFSGDADRSGTFNNTDLDRILAISLNNTLETEMEMHIQGIDFTGAYCTNTASTATLGALHIVDCNNVVAQNCRFYQNKSLGYGGAALRSEYSTSQFIDCAFTDNQAASRGGAIRLSSNANNKGYVTFERCLIANNTITENVGSAICVQHGQRLSIVNSTVYGNKAASGGAIYSNGANATYKNQVLIVSTTIAGNKGGNQIQMAQGANLKIINSIVCGDTDDNTAAQAAIAVTGTPESALFNITSGGGNILGSYVNAVAKATYVPTWDNTDRLGKENLFSTVFGNATLNDNVLKPLPSTPQGVSTTTLSDTVNGWGLETADVSLDQLLNPRTDLNTPGAFAGVSTGIGINQLQRIIPDTYYNIEGKRVAPTSPGLLIQKGKKILNYKR